MSFYEKYQSAWDEQVISAMLELFHPDYKIIFSLFRILLRYSFLRVSSTVTFCSLSTNPDNLVRIIRGESRIDSCGGIRIC